MKPASDPHTNYTDLVRRGYNKCAEAYSEARQDQPPSALELITSKLPHNSKVLDLGCGAGIPITKALALHHVVTGVDFSDEQIRLARINVPDAGFVCKNILELDFPDAAFDAITAFYVLFHLPRDSQWNAIRLISHWLKPGGYFLATLSNNDTGPYTEDDFFGSTMYWNDVPIREYIVHIEGVGLEMLYAGSLGHGYGLDGQHKSEVHPLILARKEGA
jgi:SAM-dependent methyltransferase